MRMKPELNAHQWMILEVLREPAPTLASFWVPISPGGHPDLTRLCAVKADCRITAAESKIGWRVADVDLVETSGSAELIADLKAMILKPCGHEGAEGTHEDIAALLAR